VISKRNISVSALITLAVVLGLFLTSAAAATSSSHGLRFNVVKRTPHYVVVKGHYSRFRVGKNQHRVTLHGHRHYRHRQCLVVRRTHRYVVLRAVSKNSRTGLTLTSPNSGSVTSGTTSTIRWTAPTYVMDGYFSVSLQNIAGGAPSQVTTSEVSAVRGTSRYSTPWYVNQSCGTYRLQMQSFSGYGVAISSDASDGLVTIVPSPTPTPSPSPTPTPTPTPSLSPTPTPTPTPTALAGISVDAFGARGDGVTDDTPAIQAAVNSLGTAGGTVSFTSGKTYLTNAAVKLPAGNTAPLVLSGFGATIKLQAVTPRFLIWNTTASGLTFRHFTVQGFTVDAQGHHPASGSFSVVGFDCTWGSTSSTNIEDVTVKDVSTINVPTMNNPQSYKAFNVNVYTSGTAHITDVLVQKCHLAGGTAGVSIWGSVSTSNVTIDRVYIRDCWHDTLMTFTQGGPSENYHIGQYAHVGTAEVTNCVGYNSGDVGVEINNTTACLVSGSTMTDSFYEGFFYTNYSTPLSVGSDYCTFQNDHAILNRTGPGSFGYVNYWVNNIPLGDIRILGCTYGIGGTASGTNHAAFDNNITTTVLRSLTIDGLTIADALHLPTNYLVHVAVASGAVSLQNIAINGTRVY